MKGESMKKGMTLEELLVIGEDDWKKERSRKDRLLEIEGEVKRLLEEKEELLGARFAPNEAFVIFQQLLSEHLGRGK
jgi:hypothetical protein